MCNKPTNEALLRLFEIQWQDHFQTRIQTWKALEISALIAIALVGIDWNINIPGLTIIVALLLALVSLFGIQITFRHRNNVEYKKFEIISHLEKELCYPNINTRLPRKINIFDIFMFWRSNTSLFIIRMEVVIFIFAIIYAAIRLTTNTFTIP